MKPTLEDIKSKGHWIIRIRPAEYPDHCEVDFPALESCVRASNVSLRGWDFPHVDQKISRIKNYVQQEFAWDKHIYLWRAYASGQFVMYDALWEDRISGDSRPQGWGLAKVLSGESAVYRLVEVFEFATRWFQQIKVTGGVVIECRLLGLEERTLKLSEHRSPFFPKKTCADSEWSGVFEGSVAEMLADPDRLIADQAIQLFSKFHWDTQVAVIKSIQDSLRS